MANDLKAPQALAVLWQAVRDQEIPDAEKLSLVLSMDSILGLSLDKIAPAGAGDAEIPAEALQLLEERKSAKAARDWARADAIRDQLAAMGFKVLDTGAGAKLERL